MLAVLAARDVELALDVAGAALVPQQGEEAPDVSILAAAAVDGIAPDFGEAIPGRRSRTAARDLFEDYQIEEFWPDGEARDPPSALVYVLIRLGT